MFSVSPPFSLIYGNIIMLAHEESPNLSTMAQSLGLQETMEEIAGDLLDRDWYTVVSRRKDYSSSKHAWVVERFILMLEKNDPMLFSMEPNGALTYRNHGKSECIYSPIKGQAFSYSIRDRRRVCYTSHESRYFCLYRFSVEFNLKQTSPQKEQAFEFLQSSLDSVHPSEFPLYLNELFKFTKAKIKGEALEQKMTSIFGDRSIAYGTLKMSEEHIFSDKSPARVPARDSSPNKVVEEKAPQPEPVEPQQPQQPQQQLQPERSIAVEEASPQRREVGDLLLKGSEYKSTIPSDETIISLMRDMSTQQAMQSQSPERRTEVSSPSQQSPPSQVSIPTVQDSPQELPQPVHDRDFITFEMTHSAAIMKEFKDAEQPVISS